MLPGYSRAVAHISVAGFAAVDSLLVSSARVPSMVAVILGSGALGPVGVHGSALPSPLLPLPGALPAQRCCHCRTQLPSCSGIALPVICHMGTPPAQCCWGFVRAHGTSCQRAPSVFVMWATVCYRRPASFVFTFTVAAEARAQVQV